MRVSTYIEYLSLQNFCLMLSRSILTLQTKIRSDNKKYLSADGCSGQAPFLPLSSLSDSCFCQNLLDGSLARKGKQYSCENILLSKLKLLMYFFVNECIHSYAANVDVGCWVYLHYIFYNISVQQATFEAIPLLIYFYIRPNDIQYV